MFLRALAVLSFAWFALLAIALLVLGAWFADTWGLMWPYAAFCVAVIALSFRAQQQHDRTG